MEFLLIFFAFPLAVIIISIALAKILKNPILVASIIFVIGLLLAFIVNNLIILVITIIYAIISYITAFITCLICKWLRENSNDCRIRERNNCWDRRNDNCNEMGNSNDLITINSNGNCQETGNWNCSCQNTNIINGVIRVRNGDCSCRNDDIVDTRINVIPNSNNNGRTGCICGRYRRR